MRRLFLHISFWLAYLSQAGLLIFLLNESRLPQMAGNAYLLAFQNGLIVLIPKLLFTYYVLYKFIGRSVRKGIAAKDILSLLIMLILSLLLYRGLVLYFIDPVLYGWKTGGTPFFYPLGFLVALMDIGFASGAAITIKLLRLQISGKENEKKLMREKLETELKYLRNQMHPHFLFNTLNNIYALARKKSDQTPEVVMKLSKLLRFMLYDANRPLITLSEECGMLEDYLELEKIRYTGRLDIKFIKTIDNSMQSIAPLILLPFIENAFKHGVGESRFESYIHIELTLKDDVLIFHVKNSKETAAGGTISENIGLKNVKRQLELMYKKYEIIIKNEPTVFEVLLTVNLKSYAEI